MVYYRLSFYLAFLVINKERLKRMAETASGGDTCEGEMRKVTLEGSHNLTLNSYRERTVGRERASLLSPWLHDL